MSPPLLYGDTVYAFECHRCGVTFDFRAAGGILPGTVGCPTCRGIMSDGEFRGTWLAGSGGYHVSREVILGLAKLLSGKS